MGEAGWSLLQRAGFVGIAGATDIVSPCSSHLHHRLVQTIAGPAAGEKFFPQSPLFAPSTLIDPHPTLPPVTIKETGMDIQHVQIDEIWTRLKEAEILAREQGWVFLAHMVSMARLEARA